MLFCLEEKAIIGISMVISGDAIKRGVSKGLIGITPFSETQVEEAHINLHLGGVDGDVSIPAKGFAIARTKEKITLPSNICGLIEGRSKLAQRGISVEQSSKLIEPGSNSTMVLEIFNASDREVRLLEGQKIAKMVLLKITDEI
jgi:deoxycytidine triphosphate deaminase